MGLGQAGDPLPRRHRGPGGEGRQFRRAARRRRPGRDRRALRRRGRRRAHLPRHHRELRRARHPAARDRGGGRARSSFRSPSAAACARSRTCGACSTPARTRCRSTPPRCRTRSWCARRPASSATSASWSRSTPRRTALRWEVFTHGGRKPTGLDAVDWARRMAEAGAGEILLTSMDRDGTRDGFDLALTRAVSRRGAACR